MKPSSPKPIHRLADTVVNQIAAGEVVERPAAALKELLENSLDAGATRIVVEAAGGGTGLLTVDDDGAGIPAADLELALERHATSKIDSADDLADVRSFGFRGEALAAIGAVSRLKLISGTGTQQPAAEIHCDGGAIKPLRPAPPRRGTRVEMRDLFYNAPARRRFLRQPATELGHLLKVVEEAALAHPAVGFKFIHEQEPRIDCPPADGAARAEKILGRPVQPLAATALIEGFTAKPEGRRLKGELFTFVNGRPVKDRLLTRAVLDALRDLHPDGETPDLILFLDLPPGTVDVNVHPQKREVRFAKPQEIYKMIRAALRGEHSGEQHGGKGHVHADVRMDPSSLLKVAEAAAQYSATPFPAAGWNPQLPEHLRGAAPAAPLFSDAPALRFLGQLFDTYFLAAGDDRLYLVDQHALHERFLYEKLQAGASFTPQPLLTPLALSVTPEAAARAESWSGWGKLGFAVERAGPRELLVTALPAGMRAARCEELLSEILAGDIASDRDPAAFFRELLATRACKQAIKAFDPLSANEMAHLLEAAVKSGIHPSCPHGRPVLIEIPQSEIESRFRRRG
jgi:DNA mismatch repair protein MutL